MYDLKSVVVQLRVVVAFIFRTQVYDGSYTYVFKFLA